MTLVTGVIAKWTGVLLFVASHALAVESGSLGRDDQFGGFLVTG